MMGLRDMEDLKKLSILRSQIESHDVSGIMNEDFSTVGPEDSLEEILSIMRATKLHDIPVMDEGEYLGMVSYGTIMKRKNVSLETKAKSVMSGYPIVKLDTPLTEVAEYMVASNARELPVMNGSRVVGTVSRMGLVQLVSGIRGIREIKVWEIMSPVVEAAMAKDKLSEALETMRVLDVRTLPVVNEENEPVGIVGMKEVINYNWQRKDRQTLGELSGRSAPVDLSVDSIFVTDLVSISPDEDVGRAATLMAEKGISTLPAVEEGKLVGIITKYDIMELLAAARDREMVFVQVSGLDDDDRYYLDAMDNEIRNELTKIARMYSPQALTLHVAKYHAQGGRSKYSVSGRLTVGGTILMAKAVDWDLIKTTEQLMRKLLGMVSDMKESKLDRRRGR